MYCHEMWETIALRKPTRSYSRDVKMWKEDLLITKLMKAKTALKKWTDLCAKVKADGTRKKAPGRKEAKRHAAMVGMKSILEVQVAASLDEMGVEWLYEHETLVYHTCLGWDESCNVKTQTYTPDFTLKNGVLLEAKGKMTLDTRKKMVAVKRCHPDRRICMIFGYANNKLSARPNATRYWQWAEAEGFEWSDIVVKKEWTI